MSCTEQLEKYRTCQTVNYKNALQWMELQPFKYIRQNPSSIVHNFVFIHACVLFSTFSPNSLDGICGKVGPVNQVNHTSWDAIVTPTDRHKSGRCVIEVFCGVVYIVTLPFWHFCWCRGFCHRTESDLFLFLLMKYDGDSKPHFCFPVSLLKQ